MSIFKKTFALVLFLIFSSLVFSGAASAVVVSDMTFLGGINTWHSYIFRGGNSNYWGQTAGEYQANVDGSVTVGYFFHPWRQGVFSSGTELGLSSIQGALEAAWLMDQYAVGAGNWDPHTAEKDAQATALAFAIFEVANTPITEAYNIGSGSFSISGGNVLAQAYLDAIPEEQLNTADLASRYQLLRADESGFYFLSQNSASSPNAVPEPATMALFGIGLAGMALRKRFV